MILRRGFCDHHVAPHDLLSGFHDRRDVLHDFQASRRSASQILRDHRRQFKATSRRCRCRPAHASLPRGGLRDHQDAPRDLQGGLRDRQDVPHDLLLLFWRERLIHPAISGQALRDSKTTVLMQASAREPLEGAASVITEMILAADGRPP